MHDTIIEFLKATESSRISFRGCVWVCWSKKHQQWALYVHRAFDDTAPVDLVLLTDDINDALARVYAARSMPTLSEVEL